MSKKKTITAVEAENPAAAEPVVYIGPTIKTIAARNTVYDNGITPALENGCKAHPELKSLIIPVSKLAEATRQIQAKDGALYAFYQKAENTNYKED